mgnify:CR=1 FL=1
MPAHPAFRPVEPPLRPPNRLERHQRDAVQREIAARGPFDILLNNAGVNRIRSITEVTEEDYDAVLNLNLKSALFVAQAVAKSRDRQCARDGGRYFAGRQSDRLYQNH